RLSDRVGETLVREDELAAAVDEAVLRADGVGGTQHPFDERVRVDLHQLAVVERTRLPLVAVAHDVARLRRLLRDEAPLESGPHAGAAASTQSGRLDDLDHFLWRHLRERLADGLV